MQSSDSLTIVQTIRNPRLDIKQIQPLLDCSKTDFLNFEMCDRGFLSKQNELLSTSAQNGLLLSFLDPKLFICYREAVSDL